MKNIARGARLHLQRGRCSVLFSALFPTAPRSLHASSVVTGGVVAGTILYKVLWVGFPPDIATWEEESDIPCGEVDFVAQYEAALNEEAAEELEEDEEDSEDSSGES